MSGLDRPNFILTKPAAALSEQTPVNGNGRHSPSISIKNTSADTHRSASPAHRAPPARIHLNSSNLQPQAPAPLAMFPDQIRVNMSLPLCGVLEIDADSRRTGENILILVSLAIAVCKIYQLGEEELALEVSCIATVAALCMLRPHLIRRTLGNHLYMTDGRNYRSCPDDGGLTALLLAPMISLTMLCLSMRQLSVQGAQPSLSVLPLQWLIDPPLVLTGSAIKYTALEALVLSRRNLVQTLSMCSLILMVHLWASSRAEEAAANSTSPRAEDRTHIPKNELQRTIEYSKLVLGTTVGLLLVRFAASVSYDKLWSGLSYTDIVLASSFFQFSIYAMVRVARRGLTLGELGLIAHAATALFMETVNLTSARIWPVTTSFIKTYRLPTPLLIFQLALMPGTFIVGLILSPLLVLSRNIAQKPARRTRFPREKDFHRKSLAAGFYGGTAIIVGGLIGYWTRWCLSNQNPWTWAIFFLIRGRYQWSRLVLLGYWAMLATVSVAGWNRQLARSRRYRIPSKPGASVNFIVPQPRESSVTDIVSVKSFSSGSPTIDTHSGFSHRASDLFDAADKHVPTLGLNARRKFFHGLAVVMFAPGIALDPAFTHLAFSAAFSLFVFTEYVRYFALYPFGAVVHLFLNEFLDHKDSGTTILSHFYLLTGCAGPLWLEGPSRILEFTGLLVLGVGDAVASVVGKRIGRYRWMASSPKSLEGSAAFVISVVAGAWLLRVFSLVENFSMWRYALAMTMSSVLEALSLQNDNLTLPFYAWATLALLL